MAEQTQSNRSLIGAVGSVLIGAAILFFIVTIILGQLKTIDYNQGPEDWNTTNSTVNTLLVFATISVILMGVMGITMVGDSIIGYITGAF